MTQKIFITGGSRGLGRGLALEYAKRGAELFLTGRDEKKLTETAAECRALGARCECITADISIKEQAHEAARAAEDFLGDIDTAILNAGIGAPIWFKDYQSEDLERVIKVNLFGVAYSMEKLVPRMMERRSGIIAGMSSIADFRGAPGSSSYNASKAALTTLLESARIELKQYNIRVVTIRPGFVKTELTDKNKFHMPFLMSAEKAVKIIIRRTERGDDYITFPWQTALAGRIGKILPNFIYDKLAGMKSK